ncbi:Tropomodulin-2 [Saguinus oedipus]|uniref:Tropomodulin-2 n=1 Tax=Saguinus oedipus TaxID=9490 RepID=A0ABQ9V5I4_SAGOE|nr:Tropomodulin-2 [Saguinus oedipus]
MALPFQKELEKYKNIDEDELLGKLSEEELKQLENVLDDLDPEEGISKLNQAGINIFLTVSGGGRGSSSVQASIHPSFLLTPLSCQSAMLPAGFRQKDQTQKAATGPFDREHLLMYLEKEALEQKDREDFVPFTGEKKAVGARAPSS